MSVDVITKFNSCLIQYTRYTLNIPIYKILNKAMEPQCQYYVVRKKRLCRMTVRPGRQYCGEHSPQVETDHNQDDTRIPCPNDPKHTCYVSRLQKHLSVCNGRRQPEPDYIVRDANAPPLPSADCARRPLAEYSSSEVQNVIDKLDRLYDENVAGHIDSIPELPIHDVVMEEFKTAGRTENSLRHLRQVSSILHLVEMQGLVQDKTCYVELGAGKGHLSLYASLAWCEDGTGSCVLLVDRASLRHKRDNKLRARPGLAWRVRADLAHLVLERAPGVQASAAAVGLAKHLCGVATDYALRCVANGSSSKAAGAVVATCCHHRCQRSAYVGELQELGISNEEFNIMLGLVSWATCGHGRSRQPRDEDSAAINLNDRHNVHHSYHNSNDNYEAEIKSSQTEDRNESHQDSQQTNVSKRRIHLDARRREAVGRRAKAVLDWGRVLYLRRCGFEARLCYFVPRAVSLENVCIVASRARPASE